MLSDYDLSSKYIGGGTTLEALARTFTLDQFAETYSPKTDSFPGFVESIELIAALAAASTDDLPLPDAQRYFDRLNDVINGRVIVQTTNNYIGVAPAAFALGDEIFVVLGCNLPLVLRHVGENRRIIVGACYVCGLNDGEAILGPLPPETRHVQAFDGDVYLDTFVNQETGEVLEGDVRLESFGIADLARTNSAAVTDKERIVVSLEDLATRGIQAQCIEIV